MTHRRLRSSLPAGGVFVALSSATTLALASKRIAAEQAVFRAPAAGRCVPTQLNRSAGLGGTSLAVSPLPDSYDASPYTQISLLGAPLQTLSDVHVSGSKTGSHTGHLLGYSQGDGASFVPSRPFRSGERVSVHGKVKAGSRTQRFAFHFVVATPDNLPYTAPTLPSGKDPLEVQHFPSRPDLHPPVIAVSTRSPQASPGDLFAR